MKRPTALLATFALAMTLIAQTKVEFPSIDKVVITADFYDAGMNAPVILLCHQARFSRGEYRQVAPLLQKAGYTCLAIDQRSGDAINGVPNETAARAKTARKATEYLDAEQDMVAAIGYLEQKYQRPVILVGSSYSASLALKVARTDDRVSAVAAFSPGEYFGKSLNVTATINGLNKPVFLTSSQTESADVSLFLKVITHPQKVQYIPPVEGQHGSKALWSENQGYEGYRSAFWKWLSSLK